MNKMWFSRRDPKFRARTHHKDSELGRASRKTDSFGWRLAMGAALVGGGYIAWLLIPLVLRSELDGQLKGIVVAALGATPLATKILAIVLLGRPTFNYLKKRYGLFGGASGHEN